MLRYQNTPIAMAGLPPGATGPNPNAPLSALYPGASVYGSIQSQQADPAAVWMQDESGQRESQRSELTPIPEANPVQLALAKQMMATGSSTAPVRSPLEGLARTLTGVAGGYFAGEAGRAQQARQDALGGRIGQLTGLSEEEAQGLSPEQALAVAGLTETRKAAQAKAETAGKKEGFSQEKNLRKEYSDLSKIFREQRAGYERVLESAKDASGAGDLALVFSFMKVLDPGSAVKEGEFATAENSGGVPAWLRSKYNQVVGDGRLDPTLRRDFVKRASMLYGSALRSQRGLEDEYGGLAEQYGLDRNRILPDYVRGLEPVNIDEFMPVDPGQTGTPVPTVDASVTGEPKTPPDEFTDEETGITYVLDPDQGRYVRKN